MTLVAHSVEGSIQPEGWSYMITWCARRSCWWSSTGGLGVGQLLRS